MDAFGLALNQGRKELLEAQQNLKVLALRVSQLESLVSQLEALTTSRTMGAAITFSLFDNPKTIAPLTVAECKDDAPSDTQPVPLWKALVSALNGKKSDFTVQDAIAALERTGRFISSPNRVNIVRNTIIQNKNFGKLNPGHYFVVGYGSQQLDTNEKEATEVAS